jgi:hypothetical protein
MSDDLNAMESVPESSAPDALPAESTITHAVEPIEKTMERAYDRSNPPRGTNGTFARPERTENEPSPESERNNQPQGIAYPQSWPAKLQAHWQSLPPEVQQQIAEREAQAHQRITRGGEAERFAQSLDGAFQQFVPSVPQELRTEAVTRLLAAHRALESNPEQAIHYLAQQYGVAIGHDPANWEARQAQLAQEAMRDLYHQQAVRLEKVVSSFAKDKADHWKDLEGDIAAHARVLADDPDLTTKERIELAYQRALATRPDIAGRINGAQRKAEEAKRKAEAIRKADEARRLASLNVRSVEGKAPKPARLSLEAEMAEVYDRVARRV